jgi:hypothetical protein
MAKTQQLLESRESCEVKSRKNCRALSREAEMRICHSLGPCQQTFIESLDTAVLKPRCLENVSLKFGQISVLLWCLAD